MLRSNFKLVSLFTVILLAVIDCTANVNYVGKEFEPTNTVDVYFSQEEIEKEYTVIGYAIGSGGDFVSNDKVQKKLIEEAKSKGADAILITGIGKSNIPSGVGSIDEKTNKRVIFEIQIAQLITRN